MDLMAGLNVTSPAMPWSHPDELSPEDERRNALDALEGRSTPPKPEVPLAPAPQPEPTAPPQDPPSPEHWRSAFPASNMVNKRASWGAIPTTAEPVKSDLGSLIEEEEEEEGVAELPSMASPPAAQGKRHRPASLCFPPRSASRSSNIIAETHGTPSSSTYPPFDSAISFNPEYHKSPPPPPADDVSAAARRPLKSLSLSLSSSSNTSTSAALPSSPASGCNATADQTTTKQQRRASGLRSLTLASNNSRLPNSPSLSSLPDVPSPATNAAMSPLANRRVSIGAAGSRSRAASLASSGNSSRQRPKGSSISYRYNGEPTNNSMWQRCASQDEDEQSEWGANESDFGAMVRCSFYAFVHGFSSNIQHQSESASAVAALRSQIDTLQHEASGLREELATAKALHASSSASAADAASVLEKRVAELQTRLSEHSDAHKLSQNQLENEVAEMRAQLQDAVDERDALVEDVDGWRSRCSDLTHALQREKQALDTEKKDGALAREKVRKLGDRLAAMSGPQEASPENDDALTTAQAKLINEMRDQIFSLAAALDQEKRQHHSVAQQFEELQQQQQQQQAAWPLESSGASFLPSSLSSSSSSFGAAADDSSFTTQSSFESAFGNHKPDFSTSLNAGALHTLAEEDEEEEDAVTALEQPTPRDDEAGWSDEDQVPELDFRGTQTRAQHLQGGASKPGSTASSVSLNDIQETRTPPLPQQPTESSHRRSDSFIKQWTFPKGPVTPLHILQPDDHCFFSSKLSCFFGPTIRTDLPVCSLHL